MYILERADITYLEELLLKNDELQILSFEELKDIPQTHISQFCVQHGFYLLPTTELIDFLMPLIAGKKTIEIGAGCGILGKALGIICTDNFMQNIPKYRSRYLEQGQTPINYGNHVVKMDAHTALVKLKPKVVIAGWVTHKYNPSEHWREENEIGINEHEIIRKATYIHIGNIGVHKNKPIQDISNEVYSPSWLLSRSMSKDLNVIQIWK